MTADDIKAALVDRTVLALTAWAEGRGDWREGNSSVEEQIAIMVVCRNRLPRHRAFLADDPTFKSVCLAPKQFSCWNPGTDTNHLALLALAERVITGKPMIDSLFDETLFLADGVISGVLQDRTDGATMYYAPKAMVPRGRKPGTAVGKRLLPIGEQRFYRDV